MNKKRVLSFSVILASLVLLLFSCASTPPVEPLAPIVEESVREAVVTPDPVEPVAMVPSSKISLIFPDRHVKVRPVARYGDRLVVTNQTGYVLKHFDLFSDAMYLESASMRNLLGDESLEDRASRDILLKEHPELRAAIEQRDGELLTVNAIDTDGDRYYRTWDPAADSWHIILSLEDIDFSYARTAPENQGDYLEVWNKTGYPLVKLNLEDATITDFEPEELLGTLVMGPGDIVRIQVSDVPWIASQLPFEVYGRVEVKAVDSDGDSYVKYWHPTTDSWLVELSADDLAWLEPDAPKPSGERLLHVTNNSGFSIWFLYIVATDMDMPDSFTDDLLGADVLYDGDSMWLDLSQATHLDSYFSSPSEDPVYLVAEDGSGEQFHLPWNPSTDSWKITLTGDNLIRRSHQDTVWENKMLNLTNHSGFDIWYLHLVTKEMLERQADYGDDLLGDKLLKENSSIALDLKNVGHLASYLEGFAQEEPLYLVAIDLVDDIHIMAWNPQVDPWTITLTAESFVYDELPDPIYGWVPLSVVNRTGEDIWFLYLVTDAMYEAGDEGRDVLDYEFLYADETFHLIPERLGWVNAAFVEDPGAGIHILAYTYDDRLYHRHWRPSSDGWVVELDESDFLVR